MATSDTVVGIVGAVILTTAMFAVFYYENQSTADTPATVIGDGADSFTFEYQRGQAFAVASGTTLNGHAAASLNTGSTDTYAFQVPAYAYNVTATITWTEDSDSVSPPVPLASGPDTLSLNLLSPTDAQYGPVAESSGSISLFHNHTPESEVTPPQMSVVVRGDAEADARAALADATADAHGVGSWTVTVTVDDAANQQAAAPTDTGNSYTITVFYDYWEPVLTASPTAS